MSDNGSNSPVALFTKTIVTSPVVKWIVPVNLRHRSLDDVVFVGDDFIHVKEVKRSGQLKHVYTHTEFAGRICAADAFAIDGDLPREDDLIGSILQDEPLPRDALPSQLLVLTLDTQAILFLYLAQQSSGRLELKSQSVPLPRYPVQRLQVAHHLAVDRDSRALAVAAMEDHFILNATKPPAELRRELQQQEEEWCPVTQLQPVSVAGTIQSIVFLHPTRAEPNHIIFLAVIVQRRQTRLVWYDWLYTGSIVQLQRHGPLAIDAPRCVPHLVIPLSEAHFILVHGSAMSYVTGILSGSVAQSSVPAIDFQHTPEYPGISSMAPIWANWCRPMRSFPTNVPRDALYLAREDGKVFLLDIANTNITTSFAGDLQCHVSSAFASLGRNDRDPDLLAVVGDMSTGQVASIGDWSLLAPASQSSRDAALTMNLVGLLPNWSSMNDTFVTSAATARHERRSCDSLFVTGGRQPFAALTEIRRGIEAQISVFTPLYDDDDGIRGVDDVWALHDITDGSVILLLSTPETTIVLCFSATTDSIGGVDTSAFDIDDRTLAADVLMRGHIVQVTRTAISVTTGLFPGFDDHNKLVQPESTLITAAVIEPEAGLIVCVEMQHDQYAVVPYFCDHDDELSDFLAKVARLPSGPTVRCTARPLALASAIVEGTVFVLVVHVGGSARLLVCHNRELHEALSFRITHEDNDCCESAVMLRPPNEQQAAMLKVVCGLRSGGLYHATIHLQSGLRLTDERFVDFGQSPVKLSRHSSMPSEAMSFSGIDTCLLSLDPEDTAGLAVQSAWLTDKNRPDFSQGCIFGFSRMPPSDVLPKSRVLGPAGDHLVMLSEGVLNFVDLAREVATIPRQVPLHGSSSRLIYASSHRCWVNAATHCFVRSINGRDYRQAYPIIEFISSRNTSKRKHFALQPGEEVYAMLEWTHRAVEDKLHSFILIGGAAGGKHQQAPKGRIHFLRPDMHRDGSEVSSARPLTFDSPVYALALYDTLTFVACHGNDISLHRFDPIGRKWLQICRPFTGTDRAVCVSCHGPTIYVTTSRDAMMTFALRELDESSADETHELVAVTVATQAAVGLSHLVTSGSSCNGSQVALMSTKEQSLIGYTIPSSISSSSSFRTSSSTGTTHLQTMNTVILAALKQSVVRIRTGNFRPSWKGALPQGVLVDNVMGTCTDGSVIGMLVIDQKLWRRLFWLQRLCEWSSDALDTSGRYTTGNSDVLGEADDLPIGLSESNSEITLCPPFSRAERARNMHIDGDVLASILDHGGAEAVQTMITKASERKDEVGRWIRDHLTEERAAVAGCVADLRLLLDAWF